LHRVVVRAGVLLDAELGGLHHKRPHDGEPLLGSRKVGLDLRHLGPLQGVGFGETVGVEGDGDLPLPQHGTEVIGHLYADPPLVAVPLQELSISHAQSCLGAPTKCPKMAPESPKIKGVLAYFWWRGSFPFSPPFPSRSIPASGAGSACSR